MSNALITKDYNGTPFVFREDGYFNMTHAAKKFGKRVDHFLENAETSAYIEAISELIPGIPVITSKKGYHTHPSVGTFGHPKLAVFFARWLDVKFAVWCDMMIEDILTKKAEVTIVKPQESAVLQASTPDVMLFIQQLAQGTMLQQQQIAALAQKQEQIEATFDAKVQKLEKDNQFSQDMLTIHEFFSTYGIQIRRGARRSVVGKVVGMKRFTLGRPCGQYSGFLGFGVPTY